MGEAVKLNIERDRLISAVLAALARGDKDASRVLSALAETDADVLKVASELVRSEQEGLPLVAHVMARSEGAARRGLDLLVKSKVDVLQTLEHLSGSGYLEELSEVAREVEAPPSNDLFASTLEKLSSQRDDDILQDIDGELFESRDDDILQDGDDVAERESRDQDVRFVSAVLQKLGEGDSDALREMAGSTMPMDVLRLLSQLERGDQSLLALLAAFAKFQTALRAVVDNESVFLAMDCLARDRAGTLQALARLAESERTTLHALIKLV